MCVKKISWRRSFFFISSRRRAGIEGQCRFVHFEHQSPPQVELGATQVAHTHRLGVGSGLEFRMSRNGDVWKRSCLFLSRNTRTTRTKHLPRPPIESSRSGGQNHELENFCTNEDRQNWLKIF